jgi:hypothetical protein
VSVGKEQDEFTVRSHQMAAKAHADGWYKGEVIPYKGSTEENGTEADPTIEPGFRAQASFCEASRNTHCCRLVVPYRRCFWLTLITY